MIYLVRIDISLLLEFVVSVAVKENLLILFSLFMNTYDKYMRKWKLKIQLKSLDQNKNILQ